MDNKTRDTINTIADMVRQIYEIVVPIEDMETEVNKIGGKLRRTADLFETLDGTIEKIGEEEPFFEICIYEENSPLRTNFTIAHEIGHLFIHMGYANATKWGKLPIGKKYNRVGGNEEELQANEFAAAFLMPKEEFKSKIDEYTEEGKVKMRPVAEHFHVSVDAAVNRGRWLGYLTWR